MWRLFGRVLLVGMHAYAPFGGISTVANTSHWLMASAETAAAQKHFELTPNKRPKNTLKLSHVQYWHIEKSSKCADTDIAAVRTLMPQPDGVHWQLGAARVWEPGAAGSPGALRIRETRLSLLLLFSLHPPPSSLTASLHGLCNYAAPARAAWSLAN